MKAETRKNFEADPDTDFSTLINTGKLATVRPNLEAIIVYQNFSNFEKIVRVVGYVYRSITNVR